MREFSKVFIPGTGGRAESGEVRITRLAQERVHRAIEGAAVNGIPLSSKEFMMFAGGYSKELFPDGAPPKSEAKAMADFALKVYGRDGLTANSILLEEESTNTSENIANSLAMYPEFFEETILGVRRLGIASHDGHIERAAVIAADRLDCSLEAITQLAIRRSMHAVPDLSEYRKQDISLEPTGDD